MISILINPYQQPHEGSLGYALQIANEVGCDFYGGNWNGPCFIYPENEAQCNEVKEWLIAMEIVILRVVEAPTRVAY